MPPRTLTQITRGVLVGQKTYVSFVECNWLLQKNVSILARIFHAITLHKYLIPCHRTIAQCLRKVTSHFGKDSTRLSHCFACLFEQYVLIEECISDGGAIQVTYKLEDYRMHRVTEMYAVWE